MINIKDVKYDQEDDFEVRDSELHIFKENSQPKNISVMLISQTSLDSNLVKNMTEDQKLQALHNLTCISLGWQNIEKIDRLDIYDKLEILYLQHNNIKKIENLDLLINLSYLALNGNQIKKIEGLSGLKKLEHLNLGDNQIEDFEAEELPEQLHMLVLKGNPIYQKNNYKIKIINALPYIDYLDGEDITMEYKFKLLNIFPKEVEGYTAGYRNYYLENLEKIRKLNQFQDQIKKDIYKQQINEEVGDDEEEDEDQNSDESEEQEENLDSQKNSKVKQSQKSEQNSNLNEQSTEIQSEMTESQLQKWEDNFQNEQQKLRSEKLEIEKEIERREEEDEVRITEDIVDQLFKSTHYYKKKSIPNKGQYNSDLFDMDDEELKQKLQEKTLRILERQRDRTYMLKKRHMEKMRDEVELQANKITLLRASKMKQTQRVGNYNISEDAGLKDIAEYFQDQLEDFEEEFIKKKLIESKQKEQKAKEEFEESMRKSQQFSKNDKNPLDLEKEQESNNDY